MKKTKNNLENEAFYYDPTISCDDDPRVSIGLLNFECEYCQALKFKDEPNGICCGN
ncbi:Uncharacterized protein FWK35_00038851, partial [Aphis craccivora]